MPGFDEDDIQLDADAQTLRVLAEREIDQPEEAVMLQRERPPRFERTVQIPVRVDVDDAEASYDAGVCHISLPKSEAAERTHTRIGFH
jgi:HSP20 family protein